MAWPKGVPLSEEIKAKISAARSGQKISRPSKRPVSPALDPDVKRWGKYIWLGLKKECFIRRPRNGEKAHHQIPPNIGKRTVTELAAKLLLVGPPEDPDARHVFAALRVLMFHWRRLDPRKNKKKTLKRYVSLLPSDRDGMLRVLSAVKATALIPGLGVSKENFSVENFLKIAVQIQVGNAEGFVRNALDDPKRHSRKIRSIFCDKTYQYWKARLRGLLGELANPEYRAQVLAKIKTVR